MQTKKTLFRSANPGWVYILILVGLIWYFIVSAAIRKQIDAPAWPFCEQCVAQRKKRQIIAAGLAAAGLVVGAAFVILVPDEDTVGPLGFAAGLAAVIAALIVLGRSARGVIAAGTVISDGNEVQFRRAHPAFAQQAAAIYQAAAQHYSAQQQQYAQQAAQQQYAQQQYAQQTAPQQTAQQQYAQQAAQQQYAQQQYAQQQAAQQQAAAQQQYGQQQDGQQYIRPDYPPADPAAPSNPGQDPAGS